MDSLTHEGVAALQESVDDTRRRFLASVAEMRPRLHRFCSRMAGGVLDGEDLVQETLTQAFYNLPSLRDASRLEPWLFRIAHHRCVDFIRRERRARESTVSWSDGHDVEDAMSSSDDGPVDEALAVLVSRLPPRERASVLLMDVLGYRLKEVAEVVDSTVGAVKSALHRGRTRLRSYRGSPRAGEPAAPEMEPGQRRLLEAYTDCFNRHDWDALLQLIRVDARLEVVGVTDEAMGSLGGNYFTNYSALPFEWRLAPALVDGEPVVVLCVREEGAWQARTALRLWWENGRVVRIRDYAHVRNLLHDAQVDGLMGCGATQGENSDG